jgi:hypothetical protein
MTQTQAYDIPRSADAGTLPGPSDPPQVPQTPRQGPWPGAPRRPLTAIDAMNVAWFALFMEGHIPPGPMPDPERAEKAAADLMAAFGMPA